MTRGTNFLVNPQDFFCDLSYHKTIHNCYDIPQGGGEINYATAIFSGDCYNATPYLKKRKKREKGGQA